MNIDPTDHIFPIHEQGSDYKAIFSLNANIAFQDSEGFGFPIVFLHGNSNSSKIFFKQTEDFKNSHRVIAIDLPGHGNSGAAMDPEKMYTIPGYAEVVREVIESLNLGPYILVGYSLGGNIALQYSQFNDPFLKGIMLISSAPIKYSEEAFLAYIPSEEAFGSYGGQLTDQQARRFMEKAGFNIHDTSLHFIIEDAMKTEGKSREYMVASVLAGKGIDETEILKKLSIPIAVLLGSNDQTLSLNYFKNLTFNNLWKGSIQFVEQGEHALPIHQSNEVNFFLEAFIRHCQSV